MFERRKHIVTLTVHASVSGAGTGVDTRLEKTSWNCFNFKQPILKKLFFASQYHSSFTVQCQSLEEKMMGHIKTKLLLYSVALLTIASAVPSSGRIKREINPEAEIRSVMEDVWGGACVTDANCVDIISHCDKEAGVTVQ